MGTSVWFFLRPQPGELFPVARRALEDFLSGAGRLPADADGFVRCADVIVSLRNRRAVEVLRVGFSQYRALEDGRLDREHFRYRTDPGGHLYEQFVNRAVTYLPMPKKTWRLRVTGFAAVADFDMNVS